MRSGLLLVAASFLVMSLSGCSDGGDDGPASGKGKGGLDVWAPIRELMADVPCEAPVDSNQSPNLLQLANVSYGEEAGIHGELDIRGDLALHARYSTGGFEIVDISDPLHPLDLGHFSLDKNEGALDVKFSPDNQTALYGINDGIVLVDIRDPTEPALAGKWSFNDASPVVQDPLRAVQQNAHMLYSKRIDGADWVFLAPNTNTGIWILKLEGPPEDRTLTFVTQTLPIQGGPLGPHDLFVQEDELDGNFYLYSADGFNGWSVFNVNDPANPELVGGWINPLELAYTHTIQTAVVGGKRLVATIGEIGVNLLKVYDASNLRAPLLLGVWNAPSPTGPGVAEHNFNIVGGKLFLSYYGNGMYIFDLAALSATPLLSTLEMRPVAHWGNNGEPGGTASANIWDTLVKDGLIYLSDIGGGLFVVGYGCNAVPDPSLTSTG